MKNPILAERRLPIWTRFITRVVPDNATGCHNWIGGKTAAGYGVIAGGGIKHYAHRFIYEMVKGIIPPGMCVCHRCDNPGCVNPDHLFLGTDGDNHRDKQIKGRAARKLTAEQVRHIRNDPRPYQEIADDFGCDRTMVGLIKAGKSWDHITGPVKTRHGGVESRLNAAQIAAIRADHRLQREIAAEYGISQSYLSRIKNGIRRNHV